MKVHLVGVGEIWELDAAELARQRRVFLWRAFSQLRLSLAWDKQVYQVAFRLLVHRPLYGITLAAVGVRFGLSLSRYLSVSTDVCYFGLGVRQP